MSHNKTASADGDGQLEDHEGDRVSNVVLLALHYISESSAGEIILRDEVIDGDVFAKLHTPPAIGSGTVSLGSGIAFPGRVYVKLDNVSWVDIIYTDSE